MAFFRRLVFFRAYLFLLLLFAGAFLWQLSVLNNTHLYNNYDPQEVNNGQKMWIPSGLYNSSDPNKLETHRLQRVIKLLTEPGDVVFKLINNTSVGISESKTIKLEDIDRDLDYWREVSSSTDGRILVFSAYYDNRVKEPLIRMMAAILSRRKKPAYCGFYAKNGKFLLAKQAILRKLPENWNLPYAATQIQCTLPQKFYPIPSWVAVAENKDHLSNVAPSSLLPVHNHASEKNATSPDRRKGFAVCVKPLHYSYDRAVWLVEFFELHRILGVEHFYIYNHTVGPNVQKVLEFYHRAEMVTLLPWDLDLKSQKDIRTEGIFAALNDCLYRTMYRFNYTIMIDFDEYIVPTTPKQTYSQLIAQLQKPNSGTFIFQNLFFYLYWDNSTAILDKFKQFLPTLSSKKVNNSVTDTTSVQMTDVPYLITLFKTQRVTVPNKHLVRSKYIVRPEKAVTVGNHNTHEHLPGFIRVLVPHTTASSHHYRICEFGGYDCLKKPQTRDNSTWSYADQLIPRVLTTCKQAFPDTGQCPIAPPLGSAF